MPASIGVNLRVTGHCRQGGRRYMEDFFSVAYQQTEDEKDLEYAFFGIYDGHGGAEAAAFAKEHLMETIIKHKNFWSDNDEDVLRAIKDGYIATHYAMWKAQEKWPKTASGLPSTAGTTASVAFIRRGKIYIGHVGDSGIILGYQEPDSTDWKAMPLTRDHKPENIEEITRIEQCGGKVMAKSGVPRVVWNRPKIGHQGPVRRSTPIDEIPFLAVARSLGDLWSYNSQINQFIVSPDPDCSVIQIDTNIHRCLIFGTDGLYNMLSPAMAVHIVQNAEFHNELAAMRGDNTFKAWLNPSKLLVERALERWHSTRMRADNTSVVTLMLDPPGPPRAQVLKDRKKSQAASYPDRGLKIMTRYKEAGEEVEGKSEEAPGEPEEPPVDDQKKDALETTSSSVSSSDISTNFPLKERNFVPKLRESTSFDPRLSSIDSDKENQTQTQNQPEDNTIQIHEISSSSIDAEEEHHRGENSGANRHNLRSTKRNNPPVVVDPVKRKLEDEDTTPKPRKSMRIDHQQQQKAVEVKAKGKKKVDVGANRWQNQRKSEGTAKQSSKEAVRRSTRSGGSVKLAKTVKKSPKVAKVPKINSQKSLSLRKRIQQKTTANLRKIVGKTRK